MSSHRPPNRLLMTVVGFVVGLAVVAAAPAVVAAPPAESGEVRLTTAVVLSPTGRGGRSPVHTDAVEAMIVGGTWQRPRAGDVVGLPGGAERTWIALEADEDGWFSHRALGGGYAAIEVEVETPRVMILEASGHSLVYVNGAPRGGDPYANGWMRVPVPLQAGMNELLFRCGRGRLRATLVPCATTALMNLREVTLPDVVAGDPTDVLWAGVLVVNAGPGIESRLHVEASGPGLETAISRVGDLVPFGMRKVPVAIRFEHAPADDAETLDVQLQLIERSEALDRVLETRTVSLPVRRTGQNHRRTFISDIDGSVQYYAVNPARTASGDDASPGLVLTLHGAGVEGSGQVAAYGGKDWCHIVAPTNRRPFGFDWEDWGRLDAIEVLDHALSALPVDTSRVYLTGHSMGGHGTWHVGVTFPDRFAAIAPSAGWVSFWSYTGAARFEDADAVEMILTRATSPSDTLALERNYLHHGVYVLHGDRDDNVPVDQARSMRTRLSTFHRDFAYYEQVGAGHWWGNQCVDWPPLFDYLRHHVRPEHATVDAVEFRTANPGVSARSRWVTIEAQRRGLDVSTVDVRLDRAARRITGTTENVRRVAFDLAHLDGDGGVDFEIDGQVLDGVERTAAGRVRLERTDDEWGPAPSFDPSRKGPHRAGPFKDVFRNRVLLVYGTAGTEEETDLARAAARYDADTFWYRGNAHVEVLADANFDPAAEPDRNVVLYGNADTNAAWGALMAGSPVDVRRGLVRVGDRTVRGDDLACLFIRPRPGSETACVGAVAGTGAVGMRLTVRMPYFVSGVAYPDWIVIGAESLAVGTEGVRGAGFFDGEWGMSDDDTAWRDAPAGSR